MRIEMKAALLSDGEVGIVHYQAHLSHRIPIQEGQAGAGGPRVVGAPATKTQGRAPFSSPMRPAGGQLIGTMKTTMFIYLALFAGQKTRCVASILLHIAW
jgi:hypothetical protein